MVIIFVSCVIVKDVRELCFIEKLFFKIFIMLLRLRFLLNIVLIIIWEDFSVKDCILEVEVRFNWVILGLILLGILFFEMVLLSLEFLVLVFIEVVLLLFFVRDCVFLGLLFVLLFCGKCKNIIS